MLCFPLSRTVAHWFRTISSVVVDLVRLAFLAAPSRRALAAENLFFANNWRSSRSATSNHDEPTIPTLDDGDAESHVPVARCAGECPSGYTHPLVAKDSGC